MKFILIFGPLAVGKMTVGQELEKRTGLKLFHNHMTIELVSNFFDYGTESGNRLVNLFRQEIFEEVAKSNLEGIIFTYVWAFDHQNEWDYIDKICKIFELQGGIIYFVELEAALNVRIERNRHPHRLYHKPTKRDIEWSEKHFLATTKKYRLTSNRGEIKKENYIKIDNTNLSPKEVVNMIENKFKFSKNNLGEKSDKNCNLS